MKILLTIMILYFRLGSAQNCLQDTIRYCSYDHMEVFNNTTKQYEKYNKTNVTALQVMVQSQIGIIRFIDQVNNYDKIFKINNCEMNDSTLIYNCIDTDNTRKCDLIFSSTVNSYELTVKYEVAPIIYKVSQIK